MKRIKRSYCSYCSTDKEDERDLVVINKVLRCRNCQVEQMYVPEDENSPFHYLTLVDEESHGRRRI